MRLLHLTPGTGNFHCGSCLRDNALIKALRVRGHDAIMSPLYLPLVTDREAASPGQPIRVGGISLYLQQKMPWFHKMPQWAHKWLNRPGLLKFAARGMGMTSPKVLGEMTVGSLKGRDGRQWGEWQKLIEWIKTEARPDVVSLSNSLLSGLAPALADEAKVPVLCSLQGEDSFLDTLIEPWREEAWAAMRANARSVSRFVAPSAYYRAVMAERLQVAEDRIAVVPNGLDLTPFPVAEVDPNWPTIGYLARMIHGKGLGTLVDAFIELNRRKSVPRLRLRIGGAFTPMDEKYVREQRAKLGAAGCADKVSWHPNLTFAEKLKFLSELSVFSVPATYGEAFGLYVVEALACGVPVVQPNHGAFPELIEMTGGGVLCAPDDMMALADALESLLKDENRREQLANRGLTATRAEFTAGRMAERFEEVMLAVRGQAVSACG
jgi:glycosyltransferase involved in cell wall biosynthesis